MAGVDVLLYSGTQIVRCASIAGYVSTVKNYTN